MRAGRGIVSIVLAAFLLLGVVGAGFFVGKSLGTSSWLYRAMCEIALFTRGEPRVPQCSQIYLTHSTVRADDRINRTSLIWHSPPPQPALFFDQAWAKGAPVWDAWVAQADDHAHNDARIAGENEKNILPGGALSAPSLERSRSVILPHHLLVADRIAAALQGIAEEVKKPSHIILISPNHFNQGFASAAVSEQGAWVLPDGSEIITESDVARGLAKTDSGFTISEIAFNEEHGISALLPFIEKAFPDTPLVPVALKDTLTIEQTARIGKVLAEQMPDALLIASIDFSHYLPRAPQEFHDAVTRACMLRNGCDTDLEVDAMSVLRVLWAWNTAQGSERFVEMSHTSSVELGAAQTGADNTSHFIGLYTTGEPVKTQLASFLFTGDIMLDRRVRQFMEKEGVEYPWKNMDRWIRGTDAVVGNLEGTVNERQSKYTFNPPFEFVFSPEAVLQVVKRFTAVSLANNHARDVGWKGEQETRTRLDGMNLPWFGGWESPDPSRDLQVGDVPVTLIGYHAFRPDEETLLRLVREADVRRRFVVVMPHWGAEYQFTHSREQERLARAVAKAGADLIVGMHPHVVQDVGEVEGVPVFYSLGNFIFDQEISATWPATGMGVILDGDELKIYALPLWTRAGQPKPLEGKEAMVVYERLNQPAEPLASSSSWYSSINFIPHF